MTKKRKHTVQKDDAVVAITKADSSSSNQGRKDENMELEATEGCTVVVSSALNEDTTPASPTHRKSKKRSRKDKNDFANIKKNSKGRKKHTVIQKNTYVKGVPIATNNDTKDAAHDVVVVTNSHGTPAPNPVPTFPFSTHPDDHCESPIEAYSDITPLLNCIQDNPKNLQIYDPYYCAGSMVRHLASLGYPNVYNRKEDCYKRWNDKTTPRFDVLITNPPYSGDHMERLIEFAVQTERPWFLLLPQFVHKKDYYRKLTNHLAPFYIVPHKRYVYVPPKQFRPAKKSDVHKKSSPFVSMWYCWGGSNATNEMLIHSFLNKQSSMNCQLARSRSALRDLRRKQR